MPGIGHVRALALIQKHGTLEEVLASLDPGKYDVPDPYPFQDARRMFKGTPARPLLCTAWQQAWRPGWGGSAAQQHTAGAAGVCYSVHAKVQAAAAVQ